MKSNFKDKVFYQIYPKSFNDSNGDGFGDLEGIIERLDYLERLGIDYLWISPFYKSHQYDNGYDVDDYKSIDERYGDFNTFERLVAEASKRNIKLMLDMVFNHTSIHHKWFQKALKGDERYQKYYIFKENKGDVPTNWDSKFGGSAWKYIDDLDKYYLHLYHENQADLNWRNEEVRNELVDVLKFWKDKGVGGFRFDVINVIDKPDVFEDDNEGDGRRFYTDGPNVNKYLRELFKKAEIEDMVTVGELSSTSIENSAKYTNEEDGPLSMAFNFHHLKVDYVNGDKWTLGEMDWKKFFNLLDSWQKKVEKLGGWSAWFLNNHDQPRAISRFRKDKSFDYYLERALAVLTHTMRGSPYIYQGEEIGMQNANFTSIDEYRDYESINYFDILRNSGVSEEEALAILAQKSRDNARIPLRWDNSEKGDFTDGEAWIALSKDKDINYKDRLEDKNSIFYFYKKLIDLRKENKSISEGSYKKIYFDNKVYIFERIYKDESLITLLSFTDENYKLSDHIIKIIENKELILNNYDDFDKILRPYQAILFK
ncbi:alpha,alpha-phosphotrehalase [Anaerococcus porci]|uniref:alpha,alpha-phosphotrehalase n=1 Tax=Anaerococcus porci TaxID=2652269 RepID=UPI002A7507B9|nr:alpha,alpha-phosphotrehalase [Anaerococcus porci]MDY3007141.1 alpha,alpha-phosphotrehalase [Anaerococcus porci]